MKTIPPALLWHTQRKVARLHKLLCLMLMHIQHYESDGLKSVCDGRPEYLSAETKNPRQGNGRIEHLAERLLGKMELHPETKVIGKSSKLFCYSSKAIIGIFIFKSVATIFYHRLRPLIVGLLRSFVHNINVRGVPAKCQIALDSRRRFQYHPVCAGNCASLSSLC